jgi:hypothetical protein
MSSDQPSTQAPTEPAPGGVQTGAQPSSSEAQPAAPQPQAPDAQAQPPSAEAQTVAVETQQEANRRLRLDMLLYAAIGLGFALLLWGGYSHRWPWTGINGSTASMWDWLHLLLLPLVFSVLPIWFRYDTKVHTRTKRIFFAGLTVFAIFVILGYAVPWKWTGFRGNTLWDWLGLIVLPVTLMLMPRFRHALTDWKPAYTRGLLAFSAVFIALVLAGYLAKWTWTGFTGNTAWDWMHLLLLPLLLPIVVVPMLRPKALGHVVKLDKEGNVILDKEGKPVRFTVPQQPPPPPKKTAGS